MFETPSNSAAWCYCFMHVLYPLCYLSLLEVRRHALSAFPVTDAQHSIVLHRALSIGIWLTCVRTLRLPLFAVVLFSAACVCACVGRAGRRQTRRTHRLGPQSAQSGLNAAGTRAKNTILCASSYMIDICSKSFLTRAPEWRIDLYLSAERSSG